MIGGFLGFLVGITYISTSWNGPYSQDSIFDTMYWTGLLWIGGMMLLGIFLFPRTIGIMFTPVIFLLPIAFLISLFKHGFMFAFSQILIGIAGWIVTLVISRFRPEST